MEEMLFPVDPQLKTDEKDNNNNTQEEKREKTKRM